MIVRFGYVSADDPSNSFALQPKARPMPGFGASRWRPAPWWPGQSFVKRRPTRTYLSGFGDDSSDGSFTPTDQQTSDLLGIGTLSTDNSSGGGGSTDPWDPGQAAYGIPSSGPGPSSSGSGGSTSTPTSTPSTGSSGTSALQSILGLVSAFTPKQTVVAAPPSTSNMVLPIVLLVGGVGLVALLLSKKRAS